MKKEVVCAWSNKCATGRELRIPFLRKMAQSGLLFYIFPLIRVCMAAYKQEYQQNIQFHWTYKQLSGILFFFRTRARKIDYIVHVNVKVQSSIHGCCVGLVVWRLLMVDVRLDKDPIY